MWQAAAACSAACVASRWYTTSSNTGTTTTTTPQPHATPASTSAVPPHILTLPSAPPLPLQSPDIVLLGFSWDTADEAKMQHTFGWGKARFKHFLDLQQVAGSLGYTRLGLGRLTQLALKVHLPKVKHWSTSNWEAPTLHLNQILYAALDVLVAGQVFRALRTLHKYSDACAKCKQVQGHVHEPPLVFACSEPGCGKAYSDYMAYTNHCAMQQHAIEWQVCIECGLIGRLPASK
jgi:hypothetical protein